MAKLLLILAVPALFVLGSANCALAVFDLHVGAPYFAASASLTKVGEDMYDFTYGSNFTSSFYSLFPPSVYDPSLGGTPYYYLYVPAGAWSAVEGEIGYYAPYEMGGSFLTTHAPSSVLTITVFMPVLYDLVRPDGSWVPKNWDGGGITATAHIFGDIPTAIGQNTSWNVTPEPSMWLLLGFGLLPVLRFRRRRTVHLDPPR